MIQCEINPVWGEFEASSAMRCDAMQVVNEAKIECLVLWYCTVDAIEQLLELSLDCLPSNVALRSSARESPTFDDDDVFRGRDAFVDVAANVELLGSLDDLLLELLVIHRALFRTFDEQGGRRSAVANDGTLENKITTGSADVVLNRLGITPETALALDPIVIATLRTVLPRFDFEEEVAGVKVTICVPQ